MKKQKILFCIESLNCGGAEKSLLNLINVLDETKFDVHIMMHQFKGDLFHHLPSNVTLHKFNYKVDLFTRSKFWLLKKLNFKELHPAQLLWMLSHKYTGEIDEKFDVAIGWGQGFATYYTATKIVASKKFAWINVDYLKAGYKPNQDQKIYATFDRIVAVSDHVSKEVEKLFGSKVVKVYDVINGALIKEIAKENSINLPTGINNIVTVARLARAKGLFMALGAAKILKSEKINFHWTIVGEGPERGALTEYIQTNNLDKHVTLIGFEENPYPYIFEADIYCQTSIFEGLGLTVIEAAILSRPIVVTNFPTASEIIINEETGLIADFSAKDIAEKIKRLLFESKLKSKIISNLNKIDYSNVRQVLNQFENLLEYQIEN